MKTKSAYLVYGIIISLLFLLSIGLFGYAVFAYAFVTADSNPLLSSARNVTAIIAVLFGIISAYFGYQVFVFAKTIKSEKSQYLSEHGIEQLFKGITSSLIAVVIFAPVILFIAVSSVTISAVGDTIKSFTRGFSTEPVPTNSYDSQYEIPSSTVGTYGSSTSRQYYSSSQSINPFGTNSRFNSSSSTSQSTSIRQSSSAYSYLKY